MTDFDAEMLKLLGAEHAKAEQATSTLKAMAELLAEFRSALVQRGFSSVAAEDMCRDWFAELLAGDD